MTVYDYWMRSIPDYYKNMALDGYSPYEILAALRQQMI